MRNYNSVSDPDGGNNYKKLHTYVHSPEDLIYAFKFNDYY